MAAKRLPCGNGRPTHEPTGEAVGCSISAVFGHCVRPRLPNRAEIPTATVNASRTGFGSFGESCALRGSIRTKLVCAVESAMWTARLTKRTGIVIKVYSDYNTPHFC